MNLVLYYCSVSAWVCVCMCAQEPAKARRGCQILSRVGVKDKWVPQCRFSDLLTRVVSILGYEAIPSSAPTPWTSTDIQIFFSIVSWHYPCFYFEHHLMFLYGETTDKTLFCLFVCLFSNDNQRVPSLWDLWSVVFLLTFKSLAFLSSLVAKKVDWNWIKEKAWDMLPISQCQSNAEPMRQD